MTPLRSCTFETERTNTDFLLGLFFFFFGAALVIWLVQYISLFFHPDIKMRPSLIGKQDSRGVFRSNFLVPFLLLLPTLIILALFLYYPAYETFRLATFRYRLGAPRTPFKCVDNFTELLTADYGEIMIITLTLSALIVIFALIISLAIAYLAYQPVKGASIYRTLLIWPYAISPPVAGIIFFVMFDPVAGVIDHLTTTFLNTGIPAWSESPNFARFIIVAASVWKVLGYNILFYIAGLQTIPKDLIEAAAIDGANGWQRFRNVVIPLLSPITFFLIITNLTYAFFETYGTIDYLTRGGPTGATTTAIYNIMITAKQDKWLGRAAAQSVVLFVIVIGITVWQFRTSGRQVNYGA
ncbi:MAG: sugar ABC transporter permease [Phototrophicales bacterium]|nr:MAG: sugar ABC transporter permease [Phototrophicales bacterium]RMG77065.1 MAG: sugar ABC transporter permease [Chloroflexota bacterium]